MEVQGLLAEYQTELKVLVRQEDRNGRVHPLTVTTLNRIGP